MKRLKKKKVIYIIILIALLIIAIFSFIYFKNPARNIPEDSRPFLNDKGQLIVTTSLFAVYDFAKAVGGDKAEVVLILPPGSETHSFVPQDQALNSIKKSAIFFYTSDIMEPWAKALKKEITAKTKIVAAGSGLNDKNLDPHVWLDLTKASQMVDAVAASYTAVDPANTAYYQENAKSYKNKLAELDAKFVTGLKDCQFHEFISSGHFTFDYLAKRYHLKYQSVQGFIPDDNFDKEKVVALGRELKSSGQPYVYYEEMIMPYLGEILHRESGANLMPLNAAHNVGKYDISGGLTFINLMENNLKNLEIGLKCHL